MRPWDHAQLMGDEGMPPTSLRPIHVAFFEDALSSPRTYAIEAPEKKEAGNQLGPSAVQFAS